MGAQWDIPMTQSLRRSGISLVGDVPLGAHICQFFQTGDDLFDTAQPYFAAGLESNELCLWLFIEPFGKNVSIEAFRRGVPQFERHLASGAIMVEPAEEWLSEHGSLNLPFFNRKWETLLVEMKERGFDCLRVGGACFPGMRWEDIRPHEKSLNDSIGARPMIVLCCFPLETTEAAAIIDIAQTHHLAIAQRDGHCDVVETPVLRLRQLEIRNRQQSAVVDLGLHAIRERDVGALMQEAVIIAAKTLGTERGIVWQVRPEHNDMILRCRIGWDELPPDATVPLNDGTMVKHLITSDRSAVITDLDEDTRFEKSWVLREYRVASIITALIRGRDRLWGVLSLHSMTPRSFDEDDLHFMESVANVLALVIERNEHELGERREKAATEAALARLRAMQSITDAALGHMELDDLLREMLVRLGDALRIDAAGVVLLDERNNLICRASSGRPVPLFSRVPPSVPVWSRLTGDPRPAIIDDYMAEAPPEAREWIVDHVGSVQSAMSAPLIVEEKLIGAVVADSYEPRRFTEDELDLLRMVADRVAPAIERGRLLESVRAGRERLEALSRRLLSAQEEERRRVAIELHDELGQVLTAVKINLESLPAQLQNAVDSVDQAMQTTRDLALDLRPAMLDDLGLAAALRWYADRFAQQMHLALHLSLEEIPGLSPALATACFRVVQEALTNVARHASARNVWIDVHRTPLKLELTVRDDGAGFDVEAARVRATHGASLGLVGMEERVSLAGGTIDIRSTAGKGTEVRVLFPTHGAA
jgi:signal transduction histidine kinase